MVSKRNDPRATQPEQVDRLAASANAAILAADAAAAAAAAEAAAAGEEDEAELDDDRPHGHRRSGGSAGFGPAIAGIMHGIDADIFRDPAAIQRMQRDSHAVVKTADGTVIGIELPGEGVIDEPDAEEELPS